MAQHDYDHAPYLKQVADAVRQAGDRASKSAEKHGNTGANLAGQLRALVSKFRPLLEGKKTHDAWNDGLNAPEGEWYKDFSMVKSGISKRTFPATPGDLSEKLDAVRKAFKTLQKKGRA